MPAGGVDRRFAKTPGGRSHFVDPLADLTFRTNPRFPAAFEKAPRVPRRADPERIADTLRAGRHPDDRRAFLEGKPGADPDIAARVIANSAAFGPLFPLLPRIDAPVLPGRGGLIDDVALAAAERLPPPGSTRDLPGVSHDIHRSAFTAFGNRVEEVPRRREPTPR
ncbi:hypothetical protein F0L17_25380 [Streptomyces sp. TRM43335]|uniref:Uncharacterized protein n=1 Tax=Streptomyces taklimakanensis TaxID=2569853 RepID=A0A6G2BJI3_9ACTN|nr:hypothetical protein [Streptomyces taklimakanensis]MTE22374.1 hypothetical protein [Streptomyces taklimakanensis]